MNIRKKTPKARFVFASPQRGKQPFACFHFEPVKNEIEAVQIAKLHNHALTKRQKNPFIYLTGLTVFKPDDVRAEYLVAKSTFYPLDRLRQTTAEHLRTLGYYNPSMTIPDKSLDDFTALSDLLASVKMQTVHTSQITRLLQDRKWIDTSFITTASQTRSQQVVLPELVASIRETQSLLQARGVDAMTPFYEPLIPLTARKLLPVPPDALVLNKEANLVIAERGTGRPPSLVTRALFNDRI